MRVWLEKRTARGFVIPVGGLTERKSVDKFSFFLTLTSFFGINLFYFSTRTSNVFANDFCGGNVRTRKSAANDVEPKRY